MRLLLVEDNAELAEWVARALTQTGYAVDVLARGDHAEHALLTQPYDLLLLDLSLPGMDGLEVLRRIRKNPQRANLPVLILTARNATQDKVEGLNLGADDYLSKPFELAELEARIKALVRRHGNLRPKVQVGNLEFDINSRLTWLNQRILDLTPRELAVLETLIIHLGRPVARETIFEKIYSFDKDVRSEAVEVYVCRLRKKLENSGVAITTLRGLGYMLDAGAVPADAV